MYFCYVYPYLEKTFLDNYNGNREGGIFITIFYLTYVKIIDISKKKT